MSVCVSPSRYFSFSASLPNFEKQLAATVGDIDRAAETELGLVEQKRKGVLGHHGIGFVPAHDALAQRHRVNSEFAEGGALKLAIGRMIFDPLRIAPEAVALVQHRHVAIGEPRALVEMAAGERTEPIEMRLEVAEQRVRQMNPQKVSQRRIGAVEIHPRSIRREQSWPVGGASHVTLSGQLWHLHLLFVPRPVFQLYVLDDIDHSRPGRR
jgi:hypothetical protein